MLPLRILMKTCQPLLIINAHRFILSVLFALLSILLLPKPILKYLSSHKPVWWCHAIITQDPSLSFSFPVCLSYSLNPFQLSWTGFLSLLLKQAITGFITATGLSAGVLAHLSHYNWTRVQSSWHELYKNW